MPYRLSFSVQCWHIWPTIIIRWRRMPNMSTQWSIWSLLSSYSIIASCTLKKGVTHCSMNDPWLLSTLSCSRIGNPLRILKIITWKYSTCNFNSSITYGPSIIPLYLSKGHGGISYPSNSTIPHLRAPSAELSGLSSPQEKEGPRVNWTIARRQYWIIP